MDSFVIRCFSIFYLVSAREVYAMSNKLSTLLAIFLLISFSVCYAEKIGKVLVEETATCSDQTLSLNGAGVRKNSLLSYMWRRCIHKLKVVTNSNCFV